MQDSCTEEWGKEVLRRVKFNVYNELLYLRYAYMTTPDRRDEVRVRIGKMRELIDQRYIKAPKGFWSFFKEDRIRLMLLGLKKSEAFSKK